MLSHLIELRRRLLYSVSFFLLLFVSCFIFANPIYGLLLHPLLSTLPPQSKLIATHLTASVMMPLHLSANIALIGTMPIAFYHLWQFVAPGLYNKEKRTLPIFMLASMILFILGMGFCFFIVLPFMFHFFMTALPKEVSLLPDLLDTLDFMTRMMLLFGLCFQVPLICMLICKVKLISLKQLTQARSYVIVLAFILGMVLTPPDVASQIILALPLWLLYEVGVLLVWYKRY